MEPVPAPALWHSFAVDSSYARRATHAYLRHLNDTKVTKVLLAVLAVSAVLAVVQRDVPSAGALVAGGALVAALGFGYVAVRRANARAVPEGAVLRAALGGAHLLVESPAGRTDLPYDAFSTVTVRGTLVTLGSKQGRGLTVLPAALFPGTTLDELRARVVGTTPPRAAAGPEVPTDSDRTYVTDDRFAARTARANVREFLVVPLGALLVMALIVVAVVIPAVSGEAVPDVAAAIVVAALTVACTVIVALRIRARFARVVPTGSTYRLRLEPEHLWLDQPAGETRLDYGAYAGVRTRGGVVYLQLRASRGWLAVPAQLLPGPVLEDLRERIAAASPT